MLAEEYTGLITNIITRQLSMPSRHVCHEKYWNVGLNRDRETQICSVFLPTLLVCSSWWFLFQLCTSPANLVPIANELCSVILCTWNWEQTPTPKPDRPDLLPHRTAGRRQSPNLLSHSADRQTLCTNTHTQTHSYCAYTQGAVSGFPQNNWRKEKWLT